MPQNQTRSRLPFPDLREWTVQQHASKAPPIWVLPAIGCPFFYTLSQCATAAPILTVVSAVAGLAGLILAFVRRASDPWLVNPEEKGTG